MTVLSRELPEAELHFLGNETTPGAPASDLTVDEFGVRLHVWRLPYPRQRLRRVIGRFSRALAEGRLVRALRPKVIQASDAREVVPALLLSLVGGSTPVYDSHEDYFRQAYEYGRKTPVALVKAVSLLLQEVVFLRFFGSVFCTDEFLLRRYSRRVFGVRRLHLMRNLPFSAEGSRRRSGADRANELRLVYVGGVNEHRGVIETAEHVRRFNEKFGPSKRLTLTVIGHDHPILRELAKDGSTRHRPWIEYPSLMKELEDYDVGVCLWLRLRKFERNLPLKNFDYMGAGLPILTSNFGELRRYIERSRSGICIDPQSYGAFEEAVSELFDPDLRRRLGENGMSFVQQQGGFFQESREYVSVVRAALDG
jgi:glycosyltransferase involved in cell wall biosynthesis